MSKQWYVREYTSTAEYVVALREFNPFKDIDPSCRYYFNKQTEQLQKVLNRELPDGEQRKRKAKTVTT